jgi:hypothetical protein
MRTQQHAILDKRVINLDHAGDRHVMCAWDDCENDGFENNQVRINYGTAEQPHIVKSVFCTERHRQFFIESAKEGRYGKLPPGFRRSFI